MPPPNKYSKKKGGVSPLLISVGFLIVFGYVMYVFYAQAPIEVIDDVKASAVNSPVIEEAAAASNIGEGTRIFNQNIVTDTQEDVGNKEVAHKSMRSDSIITPPIPMRGVPSHWTPISVGGGSDPAVTLCKLDYDSYWRAPSSLPMFKDLLAASSCSGRKKKVEKLSKLKKEMDNDPDGTLEVTGLVFHETRCGSTLVADMLGSHPHHLVFSESSPPAEVASRGDVAMLRTIMRLMCRSAYHTKCFFKLQSINTPRIHLFRQAFPEVPWAFVFREPVQVMMSHLKGGSGSAVCLRSKSKPTAQHLEILGATKSNYRSLGDEAFCAAHLAYLSTVAYNEYLKDTELGLLLPYTDLPHLMPQKLLAQHFHSPVDQAGLDRMAETSKVYSKGRKGSAKSGEFSGDSKQKEKAANGKVKAAAEKYLYPIYNQCLEGARQHDLVHPVLSV
jgi:hypothetical protein